MPLIAFGIGRSNITWLVWTEENQTKTDLACKHSAQPKSGEHVDLYNSIKMCFKPNEVLNLTKVEPEISNWLLLKAAKNSHNTTTVHAQTVKAADTSIRIERRRLALLLSMKLIVIIRWTANCAVFVEWCISTIFLGDHQEQQKVIWAVERHTLVYVGEWRRCVALCADPRGKDLVLTIVGPTCKYMQVT